MTGGHIDMATAGIAGPMTLEPLLIERLKSALDGNTPAVHVLAAADLAGVLEERQLVPAVHVLFAGLRPLSANVHDTLVECIWNTVVSVRNASSQGQGAPGRVDTNALAIAIYASLVGWTPPGHSSPLTLASGAPGGASNGFFYLPLTWRTEFVWRAGVAVEANMIFP